MRGEKLFHHGASFGGKIFQPGLSINAVQQSALTIILILSARKYEERAGQGKKTKGESGVSVPFIASREKEEQGRSRTEILHGRGRGRG